MQQLRYQRVSSPVVSALTYIGPANGENIQKEIAKQMCMPWYNIEIGSLDHGSLYDGHDLVDTRKIIHVIQHPEERNIPIHMRTSLTDMTFPTEEEPRVKMSCGHAITADNLYNGVTVKLKDGEDEIKCFTDKCNQTWDMNEIIEKSMMEKDEKIFWSNRISLNKIRKDTGFTECPKCRTYCERIDPSNNGARCLVCTKTGTPYDFCWQCKQAWTPGHKCGKEGLQEILNNCGLKTMGYSNVPNVPTHRLCPNCGALIEHIEMCKETPCHRCKKSFCFVCLKMVQNGSLQCSAYNQQCTVAPRQQVSQ